MRPLFALLLVLSIQTSFSQHSITFHVFDSSNKQTIAAISVSVKSSGKGGITDNDGKATFKNIDSTETFTFTGTSYKTKEVVFTITADTVVNILLQPSEHELDEVRVSSFRTNSRIEDLPTRVEVLGEEEVGEENGIKPGNIASLLGDIAGIQIQQTSAATGNADMRIQGLPGKYTQLLRDGMPLFGGYGGSFSILQIPPLDLQQIEIVKGASSTLYGGGAIAGMVNLVSKKPKLNKNERSITLNRSTLKENNINGFFSARNKTIGYTLFAGSTVQNAADVNKDGFSDIPTIKSVFIHPRLFLYTTPASTLILGYTANYEDRKGGNMGMLKHLKEANNQFFIQNKSLRNTVDAEWEKTTTKNGVLSARGSASFFKRQIITNVFGMKANQLSWFSELSYEQKRNAHTWVAGVNFSGNDFNKKMPDSSLLPNLSENTIGAFVQDDWRITPKLTAQPGLRLDHNSLYRSFILPRLSVMYKFNSQFTTRLGGGLGYKTPTLFSAEIDERDYKNLAGFAKGIKAERSIGANWDINYKTKIEGWSLTLNQTFFITDIEHPLIIENNTTSTVFVYKNAVKRLSTSGFESYIQAHKNRLELYVGYVNTDAKQLYNNTQPHLPLTARHKFASVIAYEFSEKFRAGIEAAYTGSQYLESGRKTSGYLFGAAMIRYNIHKLSFVLNCENLLDYRLSKKEQVVFPPYNNPTFPEVWAPLEGRVINLSVNIKW